MIKRFEFAGHDAPLYSLERYESGKFFCGGGDRIITIVTPSDVPEVTALANTSATIYSLRFISATRQLLAGTMSGTIHVIDLNLKKEVRLINAHEAGIFDIGYSGKNNLIITVSGDGTASFWSADEFILQKRVKLCSEKVRCLAISAEEDQVAIGCGDGTIRLVDLKNLEQTKVIQAHTLSVNAIAFFPGNDAVVTGGRDALLKIWDRNWNEMKSVPAHNYAIYSICFSSNGKIFFTASRDKSVKVWNSSDHTFIQKLDKPTSNGHIHSVNKLLTIDKWLISCGDDKTIMGWTEN